mmetsp:Transcript_1718/g.4011  ORF Transcript_1718/g.4011 Transcript_1718/m.4011 type:complete len:303 (-) Transcript_1718:195-1103(-)
MRSVPKGRVHDRLPIQNGRHKAKAAATENGHVGLNEVPPHLTQRDIVQSNLVASARKVVKGFVAVGFGINNDGNRRGVGCGGGWCVSINQLLIIVIGQISVGIATRSNIAAPNVHDNGKVRVVVGRDWFWCVWGCLILLRLLLLLWLVLSLLLLLCRFPLSEQFRSPRGRHESRIVLAILVLLIVHPLTPRERFARHGGVREHLVQLQLVQQLVRFASHPMVWRSSTGTAVPLALLPQPRVGQQHVVNNGTAPIVAGPRVHRVVPQPPRCRIIVVRQHIVEQKGLLNQGDEGGSCCCCCGGG